MILGSLIISTFLVHSCIEKNYSFVVFFLQICVAQVFMCRRVFFACRGLLPRLSLLFGRFLVKSCCGL